MPRIMYAIQIFQSAALNANDMRCCSDCSLIKRFVDLSVNIRYPVLKKNIARLLALIQGLLFDTFSFPGKWGATSFCCA